MDEKRSETEEKAIKRDEKGLFLEGTAPGPGRTGGLRDFNTDFNEAVEEIAKEEGITFSEARKVLLKVAYKQAEAGNYNFYKDIIDRKYGAVKQKFEGEVKIPAPLLGGATNGANNNGNREVAETEEED